MKRLATLVIGLALIASIALASMDVQKAASCCKAKAQTCCCCCTKDTCNTNPSK